MIDIRAQRAGKMSPTERESRTAAAIIRCGLKYHDFYEHIPSFFKAADVYIAVEKEFPRHLCNTAKVMDIVVNSEGAALICPAYQTDAEKERTDALFSLHRMGIAQEERPLYLKQPYETLKHNMGYNKAEVLRSAKNLARFLNEDEKVREAVRGTDVAGFEPTEILNAVNHARMQNMARRLWAEDSDDGE